MKRNKEKISGNLRHFHQRFSAIEAILRLFSNNLSVKNVCNKLASYWRGHHSTRKGFIVSVTDDLSKVIQVEIFIETCFISPKNKTGDLRLKILFTTSYILSWNASSKEVYFFYCNVYR